MALPRRQMLGLLASAGAVGACSRGSSGPQGQAPLAREHLIAPALVADKLAKGEPLAILYVGPDTLFRRGRLPGARNIGEAGENDGVAALRAELDRTPLDTEVVLYCGCCAVRVCPNVRPADAVIAKSGRRNVWLLDLPTNLRTDWTDRGFPLEKG